MKGLLTLFALVCSTGPTVAHNSSWSPPEADFFNSERSLQRPAIGSGPSSLALLTRPVIARPSKVSPEAPPLSVGLTDFSGKRKGLAGHLNWHVASEEEYAGFEVQRQTNVVGEFTTIGFVSCRGSSTHPTAYEYLDEAAPTGLVYYRLRLLDTDGKATYSPVVAVAAVPGARPCVLSVAPQPASDVLCVQLAGTDQQSTLQLLDALGRVVHQQALYHRAEVDVRALPAAYYFLRVCTATGQQLVGGQKIIIAP